MERGSDRSSLVAVGVVTSSASVLVDWSRVSTVDPNSELCGERKAHGSQQEWCSRLINNTR